MKKKIGIFALVFAIVMSFFAISAAAAGDENGNSQIPFVDSEQISPNQPDIQTEADIIEEFEKMFGEGSGKILNIAMFGVFFMSLFIPALITVIVFGVLNGKTRKKIKEYERFFGSVPQNVPNVYNQNSYNFQQQPVNPTNVPFGTAPAGDYIPQNNVNNQQGGAF